MKMKRLLRKLNYLPRWAWYLVSFFCAGPFGPLAVYLAFHVLENAAKDEEESTHERDGLNWDIDVDKDGVHVRSRRTDRTDRAGRAGTTYRDEECTVTDDSDIETRWQQTEASASRASRRAPKQAQPAAAKAEPESSHLQRGCMTKSAMQSRFLRFHPFCALRHFVHCARFYIVSCMYCSHSVHNFIIYSFHFNPFFLCSENISRPLSACA